MTASRRPRLSTATVALASIVLVAGCQSSRLDDLVPLAGVRNTGTTPDLNVAQKGETKQFSTSEKDASVAELAAARSNQALGSKPPAARSTAAELRGAAKEQRELLKRIEEGE